MKVAEYEKELLGLIVQKDAIRVRIEVLTSKIRNCCPIKIGQIVSKEGVSIAVSRVDFIKTGKITHSKNGVFPDDTEKEEIDCVIWRVIGVPLNDFDSQVINREHKHPTAINVVDPLDITTGRVRIK